MQNSFTYCQFVSRADLSNEVRCVAISVKKKLMYSGADPGFCEGGVRIRGGSRREELTLVLYL